MQNIARKKLDFLPKEFVSRMTKLLMNQADCFFDSLETIPSVGIRWNELCCTKERFCEIFPFDVTPLSDCPEGFLLTQERGEIGKHPYHHGGLYYLQEPSAMLPVTVLNPEPGDRVLDLCAAPGGKSTQIAARLKGSGLLVSNEVVASRAKILLSNFERMGVSEGVVTNLKPREIANRLPGWFDKVLVDAPCSGEGMFRKNPNAVKEWTPSTPSSCAARQREILASAAKSVRPGGILVYSTCTFSIEENEGQIFHFLQEHPDFELLPITLSLGMPSDPRWLPEFKEIEYCHRIFPFHGGEGHFIAKLRRTAGEPGSSLAYRPHQVFSEFDAFWKETFLSEVPTRLLQRGEFLFLLPEQMPKELVDCSLRPGVLAGEMKKNRFVPAHHLSHVGFLFQANHRCSFSVTNPEVLQYLHGEELPGMSELTGYCGVFVDDIPLGFAKSASLKLKNHYPKGLRILSV